jgi:hypothetical protein
MSTHASSSALGTSRSPLAGWIAIVQFFFATTWTLYVIYLPQLAQAAGIGKQWVPWILVADQVMFALADVVTGFWVDRVRAGVARLGGWILGVTVLSSIAFLALPAFDLSPVFLVAAIAVWAVTSSALRSPPWALLGRHAAAPRLPWLAALVLTGSALASAIAPYLGLALRGVDPKVPFVVSTLTLLATVAALVFAERRVSEDKASYGEAAKAAGSVPVFYSALLLMAVGFQVHFSLNSPPRYLQFAAPAQLAWLMPVFWIGFNAAMLAGPALVKRSGALESMALAGGVGALAAYCATLAAALPVLVFFELLAGAAWGVASVGAYSAAIGFGRGGREGRFLGTLFAVLAIAAFARIAAYAADLVVEPQIKAWLPWVPPAAWASAALLLLAGTSRNR